MKSFILGCILTFALMTLGRSQVVQLVDRSTKLAADGVAVVVTAARDAAR